MSRPSGAHVRNRLLAALPEADFVRIEPDFESVELPFKAVLHRAGDKIDHVYFPNSGVISMLTVLSNGWSIELATVGNEGFADIGAFLGTSTSEAESIVQVPGNGFRMQSSRFRQHVAEMPALRELLAAYTYELFTMTAQNSACYRTHTIHQRLARWLLTTHDRVDADEFEMTHEFLSEMTGATRPSVTGGLAELEKAGAISSTRGRMRVEDRDRLQAETCECYFLIWKRFDRLAGRPDQVNGRQLSSGLSEGQA